MIKSTPHKSLRLTVWRQVEPRVATVHEICTRLGPEVNWVEASGLVVKGRSPPCGRLRISG